VKCRCFGLADGGETARVQELLQRTPKSGNVRGYGGLISREIADQEEVGPISALAVSIAAEGNRVENQRKTQHSTNIGLLLTHTRTIIVSTYRNILQEVVRAPREKGLAEREEAGDAHEHRAAGVVGAVARARHRPGLTSPTAKDQNVSMVGQSKGAEVRFPDKVDVARQHISAERHRHLAPRP